MQNRCAAAARSPAHRPPPHPRPTPRNAPPPRGRTPPGTPASAPPDSPRRLPGRDERRRRSDRIEETQALGQAAELEEPLHRGRAGEQPERDAVCFSIRMPVEDEMQCGGVQEPHRAEIEDETREAGGTQLDEPGLDRRHRREVELADGTNVDRGAARRDLAAERLDLRTGERHGASFPGGYEEVRMPPLWRGWLLPANRGV